MLGPRSVCALLFTLPFFSCSAPVRGAGLEHVDLEPAARVVEDAVAAGVVPGAVLLVGRGDEVLLTRAYGLRSAVPPIEEMTVDTLFDMASLTKPVATASAIHVLLQRGALRLDTRVAEHLPGFASDATVEHLLRHRAGMAPANSMAEYEEGPEAALASIFAAPPRTPPGSAFRYSDLGYITLGALVEEVDGRPLERFCAAEVFEPLGMRDAGFLPDAARRARCAPTEPADGVLLRGVVHDPRARALGGVAGHAGLFGTADDLACWCRAVLLDGGGVFEPRTRAGFVQATWLHGERGVKSGGRGLGLDVDSPYASARGARFPRGASAGHTGFTGTSLWLDPGTGVYAVLLTSRLHPDGEGDVRGLRAEFATAVAAAFEPPAAAPPVLAGIDVLRAGDFAALRGRRVGLITNHTGRARDGARTVDLLAGAEGVELVVIFAPEHGLQGVIEGPVGDALDEATGIPVKSLYGDTRRPTADMLAGLDDLVFDVQDAGVRFYTYGTTLGYAMEECGRHGVRMVVLDRPNPLGGERIEGPATDPERRSFIAYQSIPVVHGMTLGELARMYVGEFGVECELHVVPMRGWRRGMWFEDTGLPWIDPSPNLRNPEQAVLYPAVGLLEGANLSVGRGTDEPFERLGAPWVDGVALADALRAKPIPGLRVTPISFTPDASKFAGELCHGIHLSVSDRAALQPVAAGLAIAWHLLRLQPGELDISRVDARLLHHATWEAWMRSSDPGQLAAAWRSDEEELRRRRAPYLLYER